eukprot:8369096-Pyramimonas_sp.AAC.1
MASYSRDAVLVSGAFSTPVTRVRGEEFDSPAVERLNEVPAVTVFVFGALWAAANNGGEN